MCGVTPVALSIFNDGLRFALQQEFHLPLIHDGKVQFPGSLDPAPGTFGRRSTRFPSGRLIPGVFSPDAQGLQVERQEFPVPLRQVLFQRVL